MFIEKLINCDLINEDARSFPLDDRLIEYAERMLQSKALIQLMADVILGDSLEFIDYCKSANVKFVNKPEPSCSKFSYIEAAYVDNKLSTYIIEKNKYFIVFMLLLVLQKKIR